MKKFYFCLSILCSFHLLIAYDVDIFPQPLDNNNKECTNPTVSLLQQKDKSKTSLECSKAEVEFVAINALPKKFIKTKEDLENNNFRIGKENITLSQYCAFLNAVAATDSHNLYKFI